ncbi:MAG: BrnA antitoxin family protein [Verrucomicrobiota bacterium]
MSRPPDGRRGPPSPRDAAEAAFKSATTKPIEAAKAAPILPGVRELVSLRIDQDVLEHFRAMGRDWQEKINEALRRSIGK